jgi:hypothetical protein
MLAGYSPPERCGALYHASLAAEATLNRANDNRESCDISVPLLNQVEGYRREAVQARDNACAGRPRTTVAPTLLTQIKTSMSNIIQCMVRLSVEYCQMEKFAMSNRRLIFATLTLTFLISTAAIAQQVQTSVPPPGSPAATIAIPGDRLPAPPQKFGGKIEREATQSKPYWPARVVPPKGAPNGSYLCSMNYCSRYRPAARQPQENDLAAAHLGFRTVLNKPNP